MRRVPRSTELHLVAMGGLDALDAVQPPGAMAEDIFSDLAGAQNARFVGQI